MRVWIDTKTGTWGDVDDLVTVDLTSQAITDSNGGEQVDAESLVAFLDGASDSEITDYGKTYGRKIISEDNLVEALVYLHKITGALHKNGSRPGDRHFYNTAIIARGDTPAPNPHDDFLLQEDK
jgi:hypothetical protein